MPIRVQKEEGTAVDSGGTLPELPVELYLRTGFDTCEAARSWAERVRPILVAAAPIVPSAWGTRIVLWAPRSTDGQGYTVLSLGSVYMSDVAVRCLRALDGCARHFELVPFHTLDTDLEMLLGSDADARAYANIHKHR